MLDMEEYDRSPSWLRFYAREYGIDADNLHQLNRMLAAQGRERTERLIREQLFAFFQEPIQWPT